ncbi:uncharacterized protein LOC141595759 [Silene latifolia]|uniref:uncharacterized protein LOC141595759 n=1 Tax=Silene latifolia TaxID=37657 RepID=UPI003D77C0AE
MSTSNNENPPISLPDFETSQANSPIPTSVSSMDVDDPPIKRARTMYDIVSESLQKLHITQTSQENPTDIAGPSQLTPQAFSFACSFKYAWQLKFAIQGLSDPAVNQKALMRIDVDVSGFNVTVQNSGNEIIGHLCLKPSDFECTRPVMGKFASLPELSKKLANVYDSSLLYMFHATGCNHLIFCTSGIKPTLQFSVMVLENNAEIQKFPEMSRTCEAAVPNYDFHKMLQHLLQKAPYEVLVEIMENNATLIAGRQDAWKREYPMSTAPGRQGTKPGRRYLSRFEWTDDAWFNQEAHNSTAFAVSLYPEQPSYIVLRFFMGDFGYLEYMKEPIP